MTARAIGVFALVLAMASPALAGPANSTIGAKKLEQDMVHSGGVGSPSMMYEWWNKGKGKMDWGLSGELVYGDWLAAHTGRFIKIGLGIDGMLRWNLRQQQEAQSAERLRASGEARHSDRRRTVSTRSSSASRVRSACRSPSTFMSA